MEGYAALINTIRETGKATQRVADGMQGVRSSAAVPAGDAGMPGARCVGKLAALRQTWLDRENAVETMLAFHASGMDTAADLYATHEDQTSRDLSVIPEQTRGPRPF